jgi:hypothetical protein
MKLLALYLLALLDGLLCGGRVSMGRCALIHKKAYYARALVRGLLGAQVGVVYGIWESEWMETRVLGLFILGLMLSLEYFLNRMAAERQRREIGEVV